MSKDMHSSLSVSSLSECFENWARPFLKKRGFPSSTLLTYWSAVVGADLAQHTAPLRIVKDRLELKVSPAFHLDVQYMATHIIERVNTFVGDASIKNLILKKGALPLNVICSSHPLYVETLSSEEEERIADLVRKGNLLELSCPPLEEAFHALAVSVVSQNREK
jgi:hypothetical protein